MLTNIALIAALRHELQPLLSMGNWRLEKTSGRNFYRRTIAGKELVATTSGLGKVMAAATTQMVIDHFGVDLVLNFGSCGALAPGLKVGDLVLAEKVIEYDFSSDHKSVPVTDCDAELLAKLKMRFPTLKVGPLASADRNADTIEVRNDLFLRYQAIVADWEGASIVRVAKRMGIPALVLRGVTDIGDDDLTSEYENNYKSVLPGVAKAADEMSKFLIGEK
ncbi:5'-methylthioadenosine/S-adenosylhomocysteine nucleosidase [bacterium]|nr:5'-methylthioadenosine/S-adenosylhomocysteine nucleosidase [bacterium]